jgi:hypothetical protein
MVKNSQMPEKETVITLLEDLDEDLLDKDELEDTTRELLPKMQASVLDEDELELLDEGLDNKLDDELELFDDDEDQLNEDELQEAESLLSELEPANQGNGHGHDDHGHSYMVRPRLCSVLLCRCIVFCVHACMRCGKISYLCIKRKRKSE